jgi:hypothetical protein
MSDKKSEPLVFDLKPEEAQAIQKIAGNRSVRLMAKIEQGKVRVNFIACNAAFVACNAAFVACNAPFAKD